MIFDHPPPYGGGFSSSLSGKSVRGHEHLKLILTFFAYTGHPTKDPQEYLSILEVMRTVIVLLLRYYFFSYY